MEEIRAAAFAYYENFSQEQKQRAWNFFKAMDLDGDGKVSIDEFLECLNQAGITCITNREFFKELDKDGNGNLDFGEVVTLYYIFIGQRLVFCDVCGEFLKGLYFTCVDCFESTSDSYDLCSTCYHGKKFKGHHNCSTFVDSYTLLRSKKPSSSQLKTSRSVRLERKLEKAGVALKAFSDGYNAVQTACTIASTGCSIM